MSNQDHERFTFDTTPHGEGGFGRVLKGRDNHLERDVAVKVLDRLVSSVEAPELERFRREARILAKLSHPNIPSIYDVQFAPPRFLIILEFVEGSNLKQVLAEEQKCQLGDCIRWFRQIASALDHAHSLQ